MRTQVAAAGLRKAAQPAVRMSPSHGGRACARSLIVSAARHLTLMAACLLIAALLLRAAAGFGWRGVAVALTSYLAIAGLVLVGLNRHGGQSRFGAANAMTLMRAAVAALFLGVLDDAKLTETLASNFGVRWTLTGFAAAGLLSDGADGWLARRTGTASEFGSRFDMETDALFMLTLSLLLHALGEIGGWVLLSGLLRYLFVGAGLLWSPLTVPLLPSVRRKSICGVQMAILVAALAPSMATPWGSALCAVGLSLLIYSFGCDVLWLALRTDPRQRCIAQSR